MKKHPIVFSRLSVAEMKNVKGGNQPGAHVIRWRCNVPGQDPGAYACANFQPQAFCGSTDPCVEDGSCNAALPYCPF